MALGFMRRHRRWLFVFLWIIIASFVIYLGIPVFQGVDAGSPGETLAKVGAEPITVGEFQKRNNRYRQFYERLYQGRLDAAAFRRMGLEEQAFDSLVTDRLVDLEARRLGLSVSDAAVMRAIETAPEFQDKGRFVGGQEIRRREELQGGTVKELEREWRQRLLRESLQGLLTDGLTVNDAEAEREFRRRTEQVKLEYVLVDAGRFRAGVAPTDDEVKARFETKRESYRIPEKRVVSYLLFDPETLKPRITVTDKDLLTYYEQHRDEMKQEAEACASHILVKVQSPPGKTGHPEAEARKIAEGLLAQVKGGADFADLAKKSSEDQGTVANGGDLGCFPKGRMPPALDTAVFDMQAGQLSELVQSNLGFHIVKVKSVRPEVIPEFIHAKERIRQMVTAQKVEALSAQKSEAIAAALARGKTLDVVAKEEGLTVQKSGPIARGETKPPLLSPSLVSRAFELKVAEVEKEGFALPQGGVAFIALAEIQASRLPELKDVQEKVKSDLVEEGSLKGAKDQAESLKAKAEKLGLEKAAVADGLVRKETPALTARGASLGDLGSGAALEDAAFSLAPKTLSDPVRTVSGYAILRVLERKEFDPAAFATQKAQIAAGLRQQRKGELFQAFLNQARERYTIDRRPDAFKRLIAQGS